MRLLIPLLLMLLAFFLLRSILRSLLQGTAERQNIGSQGSAGPQQRRVKTGKMEKDPVCGTYVDVATSLHATFEGEPRYFCSNECLQKYKKAH
jgi:YHS domain-containing protein